MSTFEELPNLLLEIQKRLINEISGAALTHGANELVGEMRKRIFSKGLDSSGNQIATGYSSTPTYVPKKVFIREGSFTAQGKENKGNFKNGNERKTMYLEHGYKELREVQGRQTSFVDIRYSGSLEKSIETLREDENNVVVAITDGLESTKRKGLEDNYGKDIFTPAPTDLQHYEDVMAGEIERIMESIL